MNVMWVHLWSLFRSSSVELINIVVSEFSNRWVNHILSDISSMKLNVIGWLFKIEKSSVNGWNWLRNHGTKLKLSPIVVEVGRESGIWMSVLWHWASDIRLRILIDLHKLVMRV